MGRYNNDKKYCPNCCGTISAWEERCPHCGRKLGYNYLTLDEAMDFTEYMGILNS